MAGIQLLFGAWFWVSLIFVMFACGLHTNIYIFVLYGVMVVAVDMYITPSSGVGLCSQSLDWSESQTNCNVAVLLSRVACGH